MTGVVTDKAKMREQWKGFKDIRTIISCAV